MRNRYKSNKAKTCHRIWYDDERPSRLVPVGHPGTEDGAHNAQEVDWNGQELGLRSSGAELKDDRRR